MSARRNRKPQSNTVSFITYKCRDIGYGVEEDTIEAFWTGEIDTWGKLTIRPVDGGSPLYLFPDEIMGVGP